MGQQGSTGVLTEAVQKGETATEPLLQQLRRREMVVQLQHGTVNAEGNGDGGWPLNREHLRQLLREADGLLPNSWLELQALRSDLQWDGDCFEIAHYGVDPSLFLDADPELFQQTHTKIRRPFVMQAGCIEPGKIRQCFVGPCGTQTYRSCSSVAPSTGPPTQSSAVQSVDPD